MFHDYLRGSLEALLFAAGEPLSVAKLAEIMQLDKPQVWELLSLLERDYEDEKRGLLYCRITPPDLELPIHVGCVHLGLREAHRQAQLKMLAEWANALPDGEPVVVAGDFNDWRQRANHPLKVDAGLEEIFTRANGRPARTFPVRFPLLRLDRIYVKNAHASSPTALALLNWRHLSDHAPLSAEIHL